MDPDVLLAQVYRVGGDEQKASLRTGIVRRVDSIKGLIDVEVAGELLRDVPYAAGLAPIVGATVWLIEQGSWFAAVSASASSGQAFAGVDEVVVGGDPPTQVSVDLWVDKSAEGTGSGWEALDNRYLPLDGGQMRGPLSLAGNPTDPLQAVPLQYLLENAGANEVHIGADAPTDPEKVLWVDTRGEPLAASILFDSPVGAIIPFATLNSPAGWLLCDGQPIPEQFTELIALIGPNTPDLRDRFVVGAGFSYGMNARGGANEVALTTGQMPHHSHGGETHGANAPHDHGGATGQTDINHQHITGIRTGTGGSVPGGWDGDPTTVNRLTGGGWWIDPNTSHAINGNINHAHGIWGDNAAHLHGVWGEGGNQPHENRPPFHALAYHIRAVRVAPGDGGISVDDADARYVNADGDTMTGRLSAPGAVLTTPDPSGEQFNGTVWLDGMDRAAFRNFQTGTPARIQTVAPQAADDAATKQYVDSRILDFGVIVSDGNGQYGITVPAGTFRPGTHLMPIGSGWGNAAYITITDGGDHTRMTIGIRNPDGSWAPGAHIRLMVTGVPA